MSEPRTVTFLLDRVMKYFTNDLSRSEEDVLSDMAAGRATPSGASAPSDGRPIEASSHLHYRAVRATLLRWVLTDPESMKHFSTRGFTVCFARIVGSLDLSYCRFDLSLEFHDCWFEGPLHLNGAHLVNLALVNVCLRAGLMMNSARSTGAIILQQLYVGNQSLELSRCQANSIVIDGCDPGGGNGTLKIGAVLRLRDADIRTALHITSSAFASIETVGIQVGGGFLMSKTELTGDLEMDAASIGSFLIVEDVKSSGLFQITASIVQGPILFVRTRSFQRNVAGRVALNLSGTKTGGELRLSDTEWTGLVILDNMTVEGNLDLSRAHIHGSDDVLLKMHSSVIKGAVFCVGTTVEGSIEAPLLQIEGSFRCDFLQARGLFAQGMVLKARLFWIQVRTPENTVLNLDGATIGGLYEDLASRPEHGKLSITGTEFSKFTLVDTKDWQTSSYDREAISRSILPLSAKDRVDWLNRQAPNKIVDPRQWMHVAKFFVNDGDRSGSRTIVFHLRAHQAKANNRRVFFLLRITLALLERNPLLVSVPILAFTLLGTSVFWSLKSHFAPTGVEAYKAAFAAHGTVEETPAYPRFSPFIYSLENALPGVRLGQDDKWAPDARLAGRKTYWLMVSLRVLLIVSGWALGILLVAALTQRFQT